MKKILLLFTILAVLLLAAQLVFAEKPDIPPGKPDDPGPPDDHPGKQDLLAAVPNLSFPVIGTDIIEIFYQKDCVDEDGDGKFDSKECTLSVDDSGDYIPITVYEVINDQYNGSYDGYSNNPEDEDYVEHCYWTPADGIDDLYCVEDLSGPEGVPDGIIDDFDLTCEPMLGWLQDNQPWFDQPVETDTTDPNLIWDASHVDAANSWQADFAFFDGCPGSGQQPFDCPVTIDFVDWGNPLENINPVVGIRFPVEIALYATSEANRGGALSGEMTAYKMACLEYPSSKDEIFGTSKLDGDSWTFESAFATVLTNKFYAEVENPDGSKTKITLEPGIGPSGKMNFASAGGGWMPTMPGWHRIWFRINDINLTLKEAIVNNDENYIMSTGCMAQELNQNKLELTGIFEDSTWIDVLVVEPSGP